MDQPFVILEDSKIFYPHEPRMLSQETVAKALSYINCFCGDCATPYTLATHHCLVHDAIKNTDIFEAMGKKDKVTTLMYALCYRVGEIVFGSPKGVALKTLSDTVYGEGVYKDVMQHLEQSLFEQHLTRPKHVADLLKETVNTVVFYENITVHNISSEDTFLLEALHQKKRYGENIARDHALWGRKRSEVEYLLRIRGLSEELALLDEGDIASDDSQTQLLSLKDSN